MEKNNIKVGVIILNYNTYQLTIEEINNIEEIINYDNLSIIIVDNCSTNDSCQKLEDFIQSSDHKYSIKLIASERNGGYAAGNNIGLKESIGQGCNYSLIVNNDILFTSSETIRHFVDYMEAEASTGAVSPRLVSPQGVPDKPIYYKKPSLWDLTFGLFSYKKGIKNQDDTYVYDIYAPRGSCMLLRNSDIENIGFLDEGTFLYYEEPILAENLKKIKKKVVLYGPECVIHNHAKTIKTNISQKRRRKVVLNSMDYYLKKYREFNYFERLLCRVVRLVGYFSNK